MFYPDVSPAPTAVLMAVLRVYARDGRATIRSVAQEAGRNPSTTYAHLRTLRRARLVDWADGGTLRPSMIPVPFGAQT